MIARLTALALALGLALAAAGCGGGPTREDFEAQVQDTRDRTDAALAEVTTAETFDELLGNLTTAGNRTEEAADDLDELGAPDEYEDQAGELVDGLRALAEELRATAAALEDMQLQNSPISGLEFENWNRVQDVLRELQQRGLDVQPLERH